MTSKLPSSLKLERDGDIGILSLARPDKRNALNDETIEALGAFFRNPPEGVRAVVLNGEGPHFCAGLDLAEVVSGKSAVDAIHHPQMWHKAFNEIQWGRIPVVSVLHGAVVGGGLELAAATHVRVADASTYYGLPEGTRGLYVGGGGSVRIPRLIGVARVMDMMLTGRTLDAEQGQTFGISQHLVAEGKGLTTAIDLARRIAQNSELSNYAILHALPRIAEASPDVGLFTESLMAGLAETSPEAQSRLTAFLEKRARKVTRDGS